MNKSRLAFVSIAFSSAFALLHCTGSDVRPPLQQDTLDDSGTYTPPPRPDTGGDTAAPPPFDAGAAVPGLSVSTSTVDFGLVPCGATAAPKLVTLQNTGNVPLTVGFNMLNGGTAFRADLSILGAAPSDAGPQTKLDLYPGQQASLRITPAAVPTTSPTTDGYYNDTISINTVPPVPQAQGASSLNVAVKETAKGAVLAFVPSGANFGAVPLSSSATSDFVVANTGNDSAEVTLTSDNPRFTVNKPGPTPIGSGNQATFTAQFTASDTTSQTGTLALGVGPTTVLCGAKPAPFAMSASGSNGTALVSTSSIFFGQNGFVGCGTQAASMPITITNTGNAPFHYTASFTQGSSYYALSQTSGTVLANGGTATIQVTPAPIPATSAVTPDLYSGIVNITTDANGDAPHLVQLHQTAYGAILSSAVGGKTIDFGSQVVGTSTTTQFSVTNDGNAPATLTFNNGDTSTFAISAPSTVGASQSIAPTVTFSPHAAQTYTDTAVFAVPSSTIRCAPVPGNIALQGIGTAASGVSVSPGDMNFGLVPCGSTPPAGRLVAVTNQGTACTYTATFNRGVQNLPLYYGITDAPSGGNTITPGQAYPLPAGGTVNLYVAPVAITPPASTAADAFDDTLTISTTCSGDSAHKVSLHETAQGAFLTFTPVPITFTGVTPGHVSFQTFTVQNTGNLSADYTLAVKVQAGQATPNPPYTCDQYTAANFPSFCLNYAGGSIYAGQSQNGVIEAYGASGPDGGPAETLGYITLTPGAGSILCSDPIPNVPVSAN